MMINRTFRWSPTRAALSLLAGVAAAALVACAVPAASADAPVSPAGTPSDRQIALWQQAQRDATSPFERGVLADGVITKQEYTKAYDAFLDCVTKAGYDVHSEWQGALLTYTLSLPANSPEVKDTSKFDAVTEKCSRGTTDIIEPLYGSMVTDPDGIGYASTMAKCLARVGLVPATYSADDVTRELFGPPGSVKSFDESDPRFLACLQDPAGAQG